jgi:hypothetical protein
VDTLAAVRLKAVCGLAVLASIGTAGAVASGQTNAPPAVSVFPSPGGLVATPRTQIAFRGTPAGALGEITVTGSQTGVHSGAIEADSDGNGGSFIPSAAFKAGETVTVATSLNVLGAKGGSFKFTVATPAGGIPYLARLLVPRVSGDVWRFRSRPDLAAAAARVQNRSGGAGNGDIFVAPQFGPVQDGPEILDSSGKLVWFERVAKGDMASDFRVQSYRGKPVLTWWQGYSDAGVGIGQDVIYDSSYRPVAVVHAGNGLSADLHEFEITPAGTALITAYFPVYWDALSVHGLKSEIVLDSVVQEVDIPTGLVLFQWDSLDHVSAGDSYEPLPQQGGKHPMRNPFDYFHVNSVALDDDGNLLVSARNTWAAYKVDHRTGAVIWTLGGKHSSFRMGPGTAFAFQHDVRARASNDQFVTVFDDGAGPPNVHSESRGLELALDFKRKTAALASQRRHSPSLLAAFEGNVQQLPDLDDFIGWGQQPYFTEYDRRGRLVLDGRFVGDTSTYRAYRFQWTGAPAAPPAVVASTAGKTTTVDVSWNGDTATSSWRVFSGASAAGVRASRTASKAGFETAIKLSSARYVRVAALDSRGRTLATSATIRAG